MSRVALPAYASRGDYLTIKHMSDDKGEMPCSLARWRPAAQALAEKLMAERQDLIVAFVFITPRLLRHYATDKPPDRRGHQDGARSGAPERARY
jgi:hypothetical protein